MAYCPSCGDEIAIEAKSCPTCDAVFGERSAWQPLAEPPPDRDLDRIAELRAVAEQQRAARVRAEATKQQAETLVLRQEEKTPEEKRGGVFFAALIGYLVSCFVAAT